MTASRQPPVTAEQFKAALRCFPSGVTVITCRADGIDHAMTASAFSAVSLEPPLVLVCVNRAARFRQALLQTTSWGVSILAQDGADAARWFATSGRPLMGQMERVRHHRGGSGVALLDGSLATLECSTQDVLAAGDHDVVVGRVSAAECSDQSSPLVYWQGDYRRLES